MLTAKEYCDLFHLDTPGYNFNRQAFIKRIGIDFIDTCRISDRINPETGYLKYTAFQREVRNVQNLFEEISRLMVEVNKKPLSKGLFNVFYASYVIPARRSLYPEVQAKIDHKKKVAEAQWAALKPLSEKLHSDENKTKNKPNGPGKRNP